MSSVVEAQNLDFPIKSFLLLFVAFCVYLNSFDLFSSDAINWRWEVIKLSTEHVDSHLFLIVCVMCKQMNLNHLLVKHFNIFKWPRKAHAFKVISSSCLERKMRNFTFFNNMFSKLHDKPDQESNTNVKHKCYNFARKYSGEKLTETLQCKHFPVNLPDIIIIIILCFMLPTVAAITILLTNTWSLCSWWEILF